MRMKLVAAAVATTLFALPALAHPGHDHGSLAAGLMHPIGGVDHLAAMLAVGLWAGLVGGTRRWIWPAAFVVALAFGLALGWTSLPIPWVEAIVAASVLAFGVAIAAGWAPAAALGGVMIAAFGVAHGFAHGAEMEGETLFSPYAAGFVAATALLHAAGLGLAVGLAAFGTRLAPRLAGGALASLGLGLLAGTLGV
jgi:urease accessory protein